MKPTVTRREFVRMAGLAPLGYNLLRSNAPAKLQTLFVGTYTNGESKGIYRVRMEVDSGALEIVEATGGIANPSYLELDPSRRFLYSVAETSEIEGEPGGGVYAFALDKNTCALRVLNSQSSRGGGPCYVTVTPQGRHALVANYGGGNVAILPIRGDGSLGEASDVEQHEGSGANERRQRGPHAHCIVTDAAGAYAFAVDLGIDRIMIYRLEDGGLTPAGEAAVAPGAGPRHFIFHPEGERGYVINELNSTITAFSYDAATGALEETQTVTTLPADFEGTNYPADIRVSPSGRFVYGSNRGHNSIVAFAIDEYSGELSPVQHLSTGGEWPRNFTIDPTGRYLLVANQNTHNIVVFALDQESGMLTPTNHELEIPSPVCLRFLA